MFQHGRVCQNTSSVEKGGSETTTTITNPIASPRADVPNTEIARAVILEAQQQNQLTAHSVRVGVCGYCILQR